MDIMNEIELWDISRKLLGKLTVNSKTYTLATNKLPKGIYLIKGFTDKGFVMGKFIKE